MKEYIPKEYLQDFANARGEIVCWKFAEVVTKADICREFIDYVKFCEKTYMKPQIVRHPEYYKGYKSAFLFFEQILAEMDSNELDVYPLDIDEEMESEE